MKFGSKWPVKVQPEVISHFLTSNQMKNKYACMLLVIYVKHAKSLPEPSFLQNDKNIVTRKNQILIENMTTIEE